MLTTKRLKLYPASREQMESMIAQTRDPELRKAYGEMLAAALGDPDRWAWFAMWRIELHDGTLVGDLCFKGLRPDGRVEIGYGLQEAWFGQGYATEAVSAAIDWAFLQPGVLAVEAETDPSNRASMRVLQKCGFQATGEMGEEGPRFIRPK